MTLSERFSRRKRPKEEGQAHKNRSLPNRPIRSLSRAKSSIHTASPQTPTRTLQPSSRSWTATRSEACIVRLPYVTKREEQALALLKENLRNAIPVETAGSPEQVLGKYLWETAERAGLLSISEKAHRKFLIS